MDLETNIEWACDVGGSWRERDIIVFSDGGLRCKRGKASAAWIVLERPRCNSISACPISACGVVGVAYILAKGAIFLPDRCHSSFMAEALALEAATDLVKDRMVGPILDTVGAPIYSETAQYRPVIRT